MNHKPLEKLRRIWTPEREIDQIFSDLSPQTALDSEIRDYFSRLIDRLGTVTLDVTDPVPEFDIRWEVINTPPPGSRRKVTIWKVPRGG